MNLHENKELFADAIVAASQSEEDGGLGIKRVFLEKDYWITRSLKLLSESPCFTEAVFKGGTSLSKAYGLGYRFSEDVDIAVVSNPQRTDSQTKTLVSNICRAMSIGLNEISLPDTRKFSKYRKVYYRYPQIVGLDDAIMVKPGVIQFEIVSFANPYPYQTRSIESLLGQFLKLQGREDLVAEYGLNGFDVNVLDINRTATEKIVSLIRQSLANNFLTELRTKIRHFYDLHFLWNNPLCKTYLQSQTFKEDFNRLLTEDQERFKEPIGWQNKHLADSPLLTQFSDVWRELKIVYEEELPELAFKTIPPADEVCESITQVLGLFL